MKAFLYYFQGVHLTCDCVVCLFFFLIINHPQSLSKRTYGTQVNETSCYEYSLPQ